ncbi:hypothetical protein NFI96_004460 [Prochilodus magdalenae]|nr:hypothetical protein NFI96_004460 [Prochilodus magdalenae]
MVAAGGVLRAWEGKIFERFLKFLPIFSHTGESLFDSVTGVLQDMHIDIKNCRGQCFDNASNMAASPSRWKILMDELESNENKRMEMVKGLSSTRWVAHARATKAFRLHFRNVHDTLNEIAEDDHQKSAAREEAKSLAKKMNRFETAFLAIIWDTVLQRFEITSRALQTVDLDLVTAVELLHSLIDFVSNLRSQFKHLESQAKSLSLSQQYTVTRQVKRTTPADDTDEPTLVPNAGEDRFRETFFVIIDKLISALQQRHAVYKETCTYFGFLTQLDKLSLSEIREKSVNLQAKYHEDLADDFPDELGQFVHFAKVSTENRQPMNLLSFIRERNLQHVFPNVDIALRIYLTLPVSNANGERWELMEEIQRERETEPTLPDCPPNKEYVPSSMRRKFTSYNSATQQYLSDFEILSKVAESRCAMLCDGENCVLAVSQPDSVG